MVRGIVVDYGKVYYGPSLQPPHQTSHPEPKHVNNSTAVATRDRAPKETKSPAPNYTDSLTISDKALEMFRNMTPEDRQQLEKSRMDTTHKVASNHTDTVDNSSWIYRHLDPQDQHDLEKSKMATTPKAALSSNHQSTHVSGNSANESHGSGLQKVENVVESVLSIDDMKEGWDKIEHGSWKEKIEGGVQFAFALLSDTPFGAELKVVKVAEEAGKLAKVGQEMNKVEKVTTIEHATAEGAGKIFGGFLDTSKIPSMTKDQLLANLPKDWSYTDNNGFIHVRDANGVIRMRIDPPDKVTDYDHVHLYDANGKPLDMNLQIVDRKSPDHHIPYNNKER